LTQQRQCRDGDIGRSVFLREFLDEFAEVDIVFDAIDGAGNVTLCKSMDANNLRVKAKVTSVQSWSQSVGSDYAASPDCRGSLYATATDLNYADTSIDEVARFRADMHAAFPDRDPLLSMWELEGWASAQWLTDAMESCGAQLTRACVEDFLDRPEGEGFVMSQVTIPSTYDATLGEGIGVGIRQDDTELKARIDQALCELIADGSIGVASEKWFNVDISRPCQ